jgi:tRNA 2-thiocytidine biosynthesis protein TtcA
MQRQAMKQLLQQWDRDHKGRVENLFRSLSNVAPSHLLDRELFDFKRFERLPATLGDDEGDTVFDQEVPASMETKTTALPISQ